MENIFDCQMMEFSGEMKNESYIFCQPLRIDWVDNESYIFDWEVSATGGYTARSHVYTTSDCSSLKEMSDIG